MLKLVYSDSLSPNMTILDMNKEGMTCIDFDTLNQLKNLKGIKFRNGNMSYFPDKDCNNPVHEEDTRILDLPNLKTIFLMKIQLLKFFDTSLMSKLEAFIVQSNPITEIAGTQFDNNPNLKSIGFYNNDFAVAPVITSFCKSLGNINLNLNSISEIPDDYFNGCSVQSIGISFNKLTSVPNFAPLGNSVQQITLTGKRISGIITTDMVKSLPNLTKFVFMRNKLLGFDARFCHLDHPVNIDVKQNPRLTIFENPYRFCIQLLDTFATKPKMVMTSTKIPCDHHRCWMKKYASKFTIEIDDCPDGRIWASITEADVCGQG